MGYIDFGMKLERWEEEMDFDMSFIIDIISSCVAIILFCVLVYYALKWCVEKW